MSALQKSGTLAWIVDKLKQVAEAAEIAQNAADPATREQAAYDAATKLVLIGYLILSRKTNRSKSI